MAELPRVLGDRLCVLGHDLFLTYLVKGNPCTLLDLGVSATVPLIERQMDELGFKNEDIGNLVILHAHWDHVCGLPYMCRLFPQATVLGSSKAQEVLSKPKIVGRFRKNDERYCAYLKDKNLFHALPDFLEYNTMAVDRIIQDNETLDLGGVEIRFPATPGHSPCNLSAYIPSEKATIVSDAVGCYDPRTDEVLPLFFQSFQKTMESLDLLEGLNAHLAAHCHDSDMIFTCPDVVAFSYSRIREELTRLKEEIKRMSAAGCSNPEMEEKLFRATYRGFIARMYPPDYIRRLAPLLLKAIDG
ncbi:MAG TPA: MBL fold metallo-hydrolase [Desulfobacteraceae bacterium]|nr:MBL fold metallo-hydrolase [Desulfobacteraceae bacterium]